ncbi:LysR family transcriptional regulator [Lysobacter arvi]|uniref:LysR family transcriptional regulator n=1 Tax=Lysobacter arvi TaxID=3038776 RepID=A0ABU1C9Y0_9GAMM|nr:LysR family transcriptional regulator [Lysobacter arvi]MDR0181994.1 LysR family transcriptional regulator [Lysobacter arvi]
MNTFPMLAGTWTDEDGSDAHFQGVAAPTRRLRDVSAPHSTGSLKVGGHQDLLGAGLSASYTGVIAFIAVASEKSFARAADRLGIGRSAVSRSVQKLESQLSTRLFLRNTRSTALTREGELFYDACRPGVDRILLALEEIQDLRDGPPRGQLRVGATRSFGRKVIAPLLGGFREMFPGVAIELVLEDAQFDLVYDVDVAFCDGVMKDSRVIAKKIIPMPILVCAAPSYAGSHGLPASVDDLAMHVCIGDRLASGRLQHWNFCVDGKPLHFAPATTLIFNDPDLTLQAACEGQGLAQVPLYRAREVLREGALVTCLDSFAPDAGGHFICYLDRQQQPKRTRVFIDYMTAQIRSLDCSESNVQKPRALASQEHGATA